MMDPRIKALVLNGKPGHLQFYSLQRDKLLYNVSSQQVSHTGGFESVETRLTLSVSPTAGHRAAGVHS